MTRSSQTIESLPNPERFRLLIDSLDRSHGHLTVQRRGKLDHTVYLDEFTFHLATVWLAERHRRWPTSTNPYLLVSRLTAVDDTHSMISPEAIN
ncbi:hypothetical protein [Streptomyces sp. V1I1]|uniref:hypothetical protein n=1 Tax=Streptomyces sp. V1I1 TaxID=3042272 RepID=UPI0027812276|nr:hypothetical protein [Streptomyces sp. V1I1]MDQ0938661.1 hypothetical protein [Streptomyces sp. V1I1]